MYLTAGWIAVSLAKLGSSEKLILALSVVLVVIVFLLIRTAGLKRRTEQAAARVVSMTDEMMSLSNLPISRNEVGGYKLEEKLSENVGFVNYRAKDAQDQACDLKIPTTKCLEDKMAMARFEREAKVLEGIENPHVVGFRAFEKIKDRGRTVPILATEPLYGEDLTEVIRREAPMPPSRVVPLLEHLAGGLAAVHRNEVVHRNVKPGSVKVQENGRAILYNFGVAQAEDEQAVTQRGDVLGTALYLSPEAIMGKPLDPRSDLYSLGVVAFEMLTGRPPHAGSTFGELAVKKMTEDAPHPGLVQAGIPTELDSLVARLMEKDPSKRPHSAGAFLTDLSTIQVSNESESVS